jgi:hypothetical protein
LNKNQACLGARRATSKDRKMKDRKMEFVIILGRLPSGQAKQCSPWSNEQTTNIFLSTIFLSFEGNVL